MTDVKAARFREEGRVEPFDFYEKVREIGPLVWDDTMGGWLVTGYRECELVEQREDLFHHPYDAFDGAVDVKGRRSILLLKGEDHFAVHRWMTRYFTANAGAICEGLMRPLGERLVARFGGAGRAELLSDLVEPLAIHTILAVLGVPVADEGLLERCRRLNEAFTRWSETFGDAASELRDAQRAALEFEGLIQPIISARREQPTSDLISELWSKGPELLAGWSDSDVMDQCKTLLPAGGQTSAYFLANLVYLWLTLDDDAKLALRSRLPAFVEEALRIYGAIHYRVRVAAEDVTLGAGVVRRGERVYPVNAAGNRDPHRYAHPAEVDIDRPNLRRHLAFNVGPRLCVGAPLARAQALTLLALLDERLPGLRLDADQEPPRLAGFMARSFRPLHVRFQAARGR